MPAVALPRGAALALALALAGEMLASRAGGQSVCGDLDLSSSVGPADAGILRQYLTGATALGQSELLRCDTRDETPTANGPVSRLDPLHGCTRVDASLAQRYFSQGGPAIQPVCAGVATGHCCAAHESVGCVDLAVTTCVCALEPRCCSGAWDATCAAIACSGDCADLCRSTDVPQPNAGLGESPASPECPDGMVFVGTFCIDRYEASLVEVDAIGTVLGPWSPYFDPGSHTVRAISAAGAVPQAHVSGAQAAAACANAGKRLCSNTEWVRACRGPTNLTYPYGSTRVPGACNDELLTLPYLTYFGTSDPIIYNELNDPCLNQVQPGLALTGSHPACSSAEGALDMVGGLDEWTSDPAGTFRGSYYVFTEANGPGCLNATTAHDVNHRSYITGFRCCSD